MNGDLDHFLVPRKGKASAKACTLGVENCAFPETSFLKVKDAIGVILLCLCLGEGGSLHTEEEHLL